MLHVPRLEQALTALLARRRRVAALGTLDTQAGTPSSRWCRSRWMPQARRSTARERGWPRTPATWRRSQRCHCWSAPQEPGAPVHDTWRVTLESLTGTPATAPAAWQRPRGLPGALFRRRTDDRAAGSRFVLPLTTSPARARWRASAPRARPRPDELARVLARPAAWRTPGGSATVAADSIAACARQLPAAGAMMHGWCTRPCWCWTSRPACWPRCPGAAPTRPMPGRPRVQLLARALVVHRLDQATSGLLLMARNPATQRAAGAPSPTGAWPSATKAPGGVRHPRPPATRLGEIDLPLIVDWPNRPRSKVDHAIGKPSRTRWRLEPGPAPGTTRLALEPLTGRSHQLRVHLQPRPSHRRRRSTAARPPRG